MTTPEPRTLTTEEQLVVAKAAKLWLKEDEVKLIKTLDAAVRGLLHEAQDELAKAASDWVDGFEIVCHPALDFYRGVPTDLERIQGKLADAIAIIRQQSEVRRRADERRAAEIEANRAQADDR